MGSIYTIFCSLIFLTSCVLCKQTVNTVGAVAALCLVVVVVALAVVVLLIIVVVAGAAVKVGLVYDYMQLN